MAALEVSASWSSWKISQQMDWLEFTWRPSVPSRATRAHAGSSGCSMERRGA